MANGVQDKVAVITGGSSGIGLAIAQKFVQEGAVAVSADINAPEDSAIDFVQTDVTDSASLKSLVEKVVAKYQHIDILVANAGVAEKKAPVSELDEDNWQKVINIDLTGVVLSNKYIVQQMEKQTSGGSVINMSSILGVVGGAKSQAYSAAKAGVANYTKSQAVTYAAQGIRFNAVAPGYVNTPLLKTLPKETTDSMVGKMPIGRLAEPDEIANVVAFLASDEASIVTGALINADGGYTAQ
ncbi:SDR family NAD(P)-dependent oxidoreductase [Weissella thailandensis]|uniref:SDR family NAD(P)-dependent oxidoreductase n=1 Tax=Weissella thailandensis TaxID=89061 RepID=A0ABX9I5L6_9LACO|nr:SDR family oxidoreductase [Weissella thailandensis]NKY91072.1 SDR family oxidoreductase [Weissella thailandensis]RDS59425.1 SDR family NAD(P)-dependent oxidoreductase [Weissella thailandensis]GEP74543.1 oxidoreductase [Weissella thailandensis]